MSQTETRNHKVKTDYGINDYYKFYKRIYSDSVSNKTYNSIVKDYLKANKNAISRFGYTFSMPERIGIIEIRKSKREVKIKKDGSIQNNLPINWQATKKLWEENPQAKEKNIKLRYTNEHTDGYVFKTIYIKKTANYKNKSIYKMSVNRDMRRKTHPSIMTKELDAFLLSPEN